MITFEQLETEVRRLAAETPDYIYPYYGPSGGCFYQVPDVEQCIFGKAFANLGVTVPNHAQTHRILLVLSALDIAATYDQKNWASRVQTWQDRRYSWGQAVAGADAQQAAPVARNPDAPVDNRPLPIRF